MNATSVVLKFGSSVLADRHCLPRVVHEIYRYCRRGHHVLALSRRSAMTDRLLAGDVVLCPYPGHPIHQYSVAIAGGAGRLCLRQCPHDPGARAHEKLSGLRHPDADPDRCHRGAARSTGLRGRARGYLRGSPRHVDRRLGTTGSRPLADRKAQGDDVGGRASRRRTGTWAHWSSPSCCCARPTSRSPRASASARLVRAMCVSRWSRTSIGFGRRCGTSDECWSVPATTPAIDGPMIADEPLSACLAASHVHLAARSASPTGPVLTRPRRGSPSLATLALCILRSTESSLDKANS